LCSHDAKSEYVSWDLLNGLRNKAEEFESFRLALDGSNDTSSAARVFVVIRGITQYFGIVEELAALESLYTQQGKIIVECV
jgi:hypothetical protein